MTAAPTIIPARNEFVGVEGVADYDERRVVIADCLLTYFQSDGWDWMRIDNHTKAVLGPEGVTDVEWFRIFCCWAKQRTRGEPVPSPMHHWYGYVRAANGPPQGHRREELRRFLRAIIKEKFPIG